MAEWPVCTFLDGLDEFDEDEGCGKLLEIIDRLTSSKHGVPLKICVSSRPEPELKRKLERFPNLRLQDLTKHDMKICANDILQEAPAERLPELVEIVLDKANGVGLSQHDDWDELEERLKALPSKIEELYHDMWRRLNEDHVIYRKEAAQYFYIVMELEHPSIFQVMTASDPLLQKNLLERQIPVLAEDLVRQCERTEQRLLNRCAGLLEIDGDWNADSEDEESDSENDVSRNEQDESRPEAKVVLSPLHLVLLERFPARRISFLHRTARDFLVDTEAGQDILRYYSPPLTDRQTLWLRVELVDMLASLSIFEWGRAEGQIVKLMKRTKFDLSHKDGIEILEFMHQVCRRLASPNPPNLIVGYSDYNFSNPRGRKSGYQSVYYLDFLGLAASCGLTAYLRKSLSPFDEGFRVRTDFVDYLLLCSSTPTMPLIAHQTLFLLDQGANPNVQGFFPINREDLYCAFSPLAALLTFYYKYGITYGFMTVMEEPGYLTDIIKVFLAHGLDLSKKVMMRLQRGVLTHVSAIGFHRDDEPSLVYETAIGDLVNGALVHTGHPSDENLMNGQDYARTRRILLVSSGGYLIKARKVSSEEDVALLNENLAAYLSVLYRPSVADNGCVDFPELMSTPEYKKLRDCIKEVDARSEPVDVYETLMQMGYVKPRNYGFSPGEHFEAIPVDTMSDPGKSGIQGASEGAQEQEPRLEGLDNDVDNKEHH